ncbi:MAG: hypothetical protein R3E66_23005 [bacterium]
MPKGLLFGAAVVLAGGIGLGVWLKQASVTPEPSLNQTNQHAAITATQTTQTNAAVTNTDPVTNNTSETNNAALTNNVGATAATAAAQTNDAAPDAPVEVPESGVFVLTASQIQEASTELVRTTPTLRFQLGGAKAVFLADNGEPHRGDRATLATQTFCENARCGLAFPRTQQAFLPAAVVDELKLDLKGARRTERDGVSGYQGVVRWVVDDIAQLPLNDLTPVWRRWMRASDEDLDKAVSEYEQEIATAIGAERAAAIVAQTNGTQLRNLVRQISNVLVLDYLTNNFERFDSATDRNAWNLGIKQGKVYSLDDTGAFQPRASTRIKGRFSWAERFDKDVFDSAQNIDRQLLETKMFPDASAAERVTLRVFWKQYDAYMDRIKKETTRPNANVFF